MKYVLNHWLTLLASLLLWCIGSPAYATITCTQLAATEINFAFVSGTNSTSANNVMSNSITVSCARSAAGDPTTLTLDADNGTHNATGNQNNTQLGTNNIRYDLFRNAACTQPWRFQTAGVRLSATFLGTALNVPEILTFNYWGCIPGQVSVNSFPAGLYTDTVNTKLYAGAATGSPLVSGTSASTVQINIYAPAKCSITGLAAANTIVFNYTAFGAADFKFATFNANCTNLLPYSMSLNATSGVVGGLKYQLGLSNAPGSASAVGSASLASTGGPLGTKVHYINAVMDAGQAGTSGAVVPQSHTLTISY